ncbi:MAG: hypothetical protein WCX71_04675 [Candidatus Buchananbacteria bacterium]
MVKTKTMTKVKISTGIYAILAVAAVGLAISAGYSFMAGGLPAVAPLISTTKPDLELRQVIFLNNDTKDPKFTFKFCNNGISLNQYFKADPKLGSSFNLKWFTYNDQGQPSQKNIISINGTAISTIKNGNCVTMGRDGQSVNRDSRSISLTSAQKIEYAANKMIVFNIDPSNIIIEADETNNSNFCDDSLCNPISTLRIGRSSSVPAGNISVGNDQVLGAYEIEAKNEAANISNLNLKIVNSSKAGTLKSVKIVDKYNKVIAGPTNVTGSEVVMSSRNFVVSKGLNVYRVLATLNESSGWVSNDTIQISIATESIKAKGNKSAQSVIVTPVSMVINGVVQTVKAADLVITRNDKPTDGDVIAGTTNVLLGSWTFNASNSGENVKITALNIRTSNMGQINNLTLKDGSTILYPIMNASISSSTATTTFVLARPVVVEKNTSKVINLYGDIGSNIQSGRIISFGLANAEAVTAIGSQTGNPAAIHIMSWHDHGAELTIIGSGSLLISFDPNNPQARRVAANTNGVELVSIRLKAVNEDIDITQLSINVTNGIISGTNAGNYNQLSRVYLKLDGSTVGDANGYILARDNTLINFNRGDFTIPKGAAGKKLSIVGDLAAVGLNQAGAVNASLRVGLGSASTFVAYGNITNRVIPVSGFINLLGNPIIIHQTAPVINIEPVTDSLAARNLYRFSAAGMAGGAAGIYKLTFKVQKQNVNLSNFTLVWLEQNMIVASSTSMNASGLVTMYPSVVLSGTKMTFQLSATTEFTSPNASVTTTLLNDVSNASGIFSVVDQNKYFVWTDFNQSQDGPFDSARFSKNQWYDGYLIPGLTLTPTTVTR